MVTLTYDATSIAAGVLRPSALFHPTSSELELPSPAMSSVLRSLFASSPAVVIWLLFLWAERSHYDRRRRKGDASASPALLATVRV